MARITIYVDGINEGTYSDINNILVSKSGHRLSSFKINGITYTASKPYSDSVVTISMFSDPGIEEGFMIEPSLSSGAITSIYITTVWEVYNDSGDDSGGNDNAVYIYPGDGYFVYASGNSYNYYYNELSIGTTITLPVLRRNGYVLSGYTCSAGTVTKVTSDITGETWKFTKGSGESILTPNWQVNNIKYPFVVNLDGGEDISIGETAEYWSTLVLSYEQTIELPTLRKQDYRHIGWTVEPVSGDVGYFNTGIYNISSNTFKQRYGLYKATPIFEYNPVGDPQNIYICLDTNEIYARNFEKSEDFYIDNDGTIYAPSFTIGNSLIISPTGITAADFINGLPVGTVLLDNNNILLTDNDNKFLITT